MHPQKINNLNLFDYIKKYINKTLSLFGFSIKDNRKLPLYHLFGIRNMNIKTILDIGANKGQFGQIIRPIFPLAKIISFEPQPDAFSDLKKFAITDKNWETENVALGNEKCTKEMYIHLDHSPSSSFLNTTELNTSLYPQMDRQSSVKMNVITLNEWVDNYDKMLEEDILIKMDVQGFEGSVIEGGDKIIKRSKAIIVEANIQELYEGQTSFVEIINKLSCLGFQLQGILEYGMDHKGYVISLDCVFIKNIK